MPTKPQSPGPNPATSSHKSKTKPQDSAAKETAKQGSTGGIVLDKAHKTPKNESKMNSPAAAKSTNPPSANDTTTSSTSAGPNRQKRRPRKLNREPAPEAAKSIPTATTETSPPVSTTELEALKSRVRGLEAKVEELYNSGAADRSGRSPRRRGKGRKGSAQQAPAASTTITAAKAESESEADEELGRLEDELEVARRDLETYRPRHATKRTPSGNTEYIEEIPRDEPGVEDTVTTNDRQVTLTGSYRIPLPSTVSMTDVKTIQSGVSAAQNVAKSILEQRRAAQAAQAAASPKPNPPPKAKPAARKQATGSGTAVAEADAGEAKQSWSEWFGGYSVAISRAVRNVEAEAALMEERDRERERRPGQKARVASAPAVAVVAKGDKGSVRAGAKAKTGKGDQKPSPKTRGADISSEQARGLMG